MTTPTAASSRTIQESSITTTSSRTSNSLTGSITATTTSSNVLTFGNLFPTPTNTTSPLPSRPALSQCRYCCSKIHRKFRGNRSLVGGNGGGGGGGGGTSTRRARFGFSRSGGIGDAGLERPQAALLRNHSDLEALPWDDHHYHHHHHHHHHRHRPIMLSAPFLHTGLVPLVSQEGVLIDESRPAGGGRHRYGPTRGADIDSGGRRGGGGGGADSVLGSYALEELPAYEAGKSPPGYHHAVATSPAADTSSSPSSSPLSPPPIIPYSQRPHIEETEIGNLIP
ncbi:hypothetical protein Clacol_003506 [Clathrus columnatus]|uniref:Uncharacterized protein n=1 Tax=Clathrus columnatus TaxID=1419009 RepID=A0AAV5A3Q2_9AGAM|nr:hypothetical protein Clacol_003506 [Clathrus columnatus]